MKKRQHKAPKYKWPMDDEVVKSFPEKKRANIHSFISIQHTDEAKAFNHLIRATHLLTDHRHIALMTYRLLVGWVLGPEPALNSWDDEQEATAWTAWFFGSHPQTGMAKNCRFQGRHPAMSRHLHLTGKGPTALPSQEIQDRLTQQQATAGNAELRHYLDQIFRASLQVAAAHTGLRSTRKPPYFQPYNPRDLPLPSCSRTIAKGTAAGSFLLGAHRAAILYADIRFFYPRKPQRWPLSA